MTARTYHGARAAAGPLVYLAGPQRVALGEWVTIHAPGQPDLRGQVIEAGREVTVVQVLDDTLGLAPSTVSITLTG
ncbi:MAG: V-type ATP synthase subunit B, partial [Acidobacteriota bacterium]|nr:V-type ATP synthase subunit B [Acidobacteriota bacterium]